MVYKKSWVLMGGHRWKKDERGVWVIECEEHGKYFYPDEEFWRFGECPFCQKDIRSEIYKKKEVLKRMDL